MTSCVPLDPRVGCVLERGEDVWSVSADEASLKLVIYAASTIGTRTARTGDPELVRVTSPTATVPRRRPKQVGCLVGAVIVARPPSSMRLFFADLMGSQPRQSPRRRVLGMPGGDPYQPNLSSLIP